jgi:hypothetical protein
MFHFILDAANISLKKIFYSSTYTLDYTSIQITEETNKWDMASNILPDIDINFDNRIKLGDIRDVIMFNENGRENVTISDPSYAINIDNIGFYTINLIGKIVEWDDVEFLNLISENTNYFYTLLTQDQYELLIKSELQQIGFDNTIIEPIPILSENIECYPVHLQGTPNNKYYGTIAFKGKLNNLVLIVSRAYRSKVDGDNLGVDTLAELINSVIKRPSEQQTSINRIIQHLCTVSPQSDINKKKVSFLLDIKRIGDWGQINQCYNNNNIISKLKSMLQDENQKSIKDITKIEKLQNLIDKYKNLIFISLDNLAISYSQLLNNNYMHTKKSDNDVTFIMRRNNIPDQ